MRQKTISSRKPVWRVCGAEGEMFKTLPKTKMVRTFAVLPFRKCEVDKIMKLTATGTFIFQQVSKSFSASQQLLYMTSSMTTTDRFPCAEIPRPDKILKRNTIKIFRSPLPRTSETLIMKVFWKKSQDKIIQAQSAAYSSQGFISTC